MVAREHATAVGVEATARRISAALALTGDVSHLPHGIARRLPALEGTAAEAGHALRELSQRGYLHAALVRLADTVANDVTRTDLAMLLATELLDAVHEDLGIALLQAVLQETSDGPQRYAPDGPWMRAHRLLGDSLRNTDVARAVQHYQNMVEVDIDNVHARAALRTLQAAPLRHTTPFALPVATLAAFDHPRYTVLRTLGGGHTAWVLAARDNMLQRTVAVKVPVRRGDEDACARLMFEAATLRRLASPNILPLLDHDPAFPFVALPALPSGNLRQALREGRAHTQHLPSFGAALLRALHHLAHANVVHGDIKPDNLLLQEDTLVLCDFARNPGAAHGGTLRYLSPERRRAHAGQPTVASDCFAAGLTLLELVLGSLPARFDDVQGAVDAYMLCPEDLPGNWTPRLRALLANDPAQRTLLRL